MTRFFSLVLTLAVPLTAIGQQSKVKKDPPPPLDTTTQEKIRSRTAELAMEVAKLPESPYRPDVEVYVKAGVWMDAWKEYLEPKIAEKTLVVIDAGFKRAAELREMKPGAMPSWVTARGKPVIRGYRSIIDGSVQPYAVTLPMEGDLANRRFDIVLHGRDSTLTEVKFIHARETAKAPPQPADAIILEVYGRGNNAYRWAGETDVFEAAAAFWTSLNVGKPRGFPFGPSDVILRGFSMGGAGAWHIGLHHPFRFTVIGPGAGFTTTRGYVRNLPRELPDHVERTLRIYDAIEYAENAFNVPVVAYSGEKDPQKAAADNIFDRLEQFDEPVKAVHLVAPGLEHQMPLEWQKKADTEYRKHLSRNPRDTDRVRFVTYTTRYNDAGWATIESLEQHYDRAVFDGNWVENSLTITTENIRAFSVFRERRKIPPVVTIDGQAINIPSATEAMRPAAFFRKIHGKWQLGDHADWMRSRRTKPEKVHALQGPIDDAFMGPFIVVPPTGKGNVTTRFEEFRQIWPKYFRGELPTRTASDITDTDITDHSLVLFGDPQTNPLIARILPGLPIRWMKDVLEVNGEKYDPQTHFPVFIYPNPLNPYRYVVINSGHTFREADLRGTNALLYPRLGDWAVLKPTPTNDDPTATEVVAAGLFDEFWQFPKK
jgi:hypothetical protein